MSLLYTLSYSKFVSFMVRECDIVFITKQKTH